MIISFKHKGLKQFFENGTTRGIQATHAKKIRLILTLLHGADNIEVMRFHGSNLHPLVGDLQGHWSVMVNGNWRITFKFNDDGNAEIVDYQDYH